MPLYYSLFNFILNPLTSTNYSIYEMWIIFSHYKFLNDPQLILIIDRTEAKGKKLLFMEIVVFLIFNGWWAVLDTLCWLINWLRKNESLTAHQKGTTARWYSNKTSLSFITHQRNFKCQRLPTTPLGMQLFSSFQKIVMLKFWIGYKLTPGISLDPPKNHHHQFANPKTYILSLGLTFDIPGFAN